MRCHVETPWGRCRIRLSWRPWWFIPIKSRRQIVALHAFAFHPEAEA